MDVRNYVRNNAFHLCTVIRQTEILKEFSFLHSRVIVRRNLPGHNTLRTHHKVEQCHLMLFHDLTEQLQLALISHQNFHSIPLPCKSKRGSALVHTIAVNITVGVMDWSREHH